MESREGGDERKWRGWQGNGYYDIGIIDQMEIEISEMEEESNEVEGVDDNWVEEMMEVTEIKKKLFLFL